MVSYDIHLLSFASENSHWENIIYFCRLIFFQNFQHNMEFMFAIISVEFPSIYGFSVLNF